MAEKLSIEVIAELQKFQEAMATLPGIGAKEARDMVAGIRRELRNAEKDAASSAKGISTGFSGEFNKISGAAAAMAGQVGGSFGQLGSLAQSALKPLAEVGAGLGFLGAAAGGVLLTGRATLALANGASEAADRLRAVGVAISPKAASDISRYNSATKELGISFDQLEVAVGSELAGDLATLATATAHAIDEFVEWRDSMEADRVAFEAWARPIENFVSFGILDKLTGQVDKFAKASHTSAEDSIGSLLSLPAGSLNLPIEERQKLIDELDRLQTASASKYAQYMAKLQQEDQKLVQQEQARLTATEQLDTMYDQLHRTQLGPREQIQPDLDSQIDAITKLTEASGDYELGWKAVDAAADAAEKKTHDYNVAQQKAVDAANRAWSDLTAKTGQSVAEAEAAIDDSLRTLQKSLSDFYRDRAAAELSYSQGVIGSIGSIAQAEVDNVQRRIDAGEHLSRAQINAANDALDIQEASAILQAGVAATLIGIETYAQLSPFLTPVGAAFAGSAAGIAAYVAAVAGIEAHKPPHFTAPTPTKGSHTANGPAIDANGDGVAEDGEGSAGLGGVFNQDNGSGAQNRGRRGGGSQPGGGGMLTVDRRLGRLVIVDDHPSTRHRSGGRRR